MYLLSQPGSMDLTAVSVKGRCFLQSSQMGLRMLFFCFCQSQFFPEQLELSLISDILLRMLTQKICIHPCDVVQNLWETFRPRRASPGACKQASVDEWTDVHHP